MLDNVPIQLNLNTQPETILNSKIVDEIEQEVNTSVLNTSVLDKTLADAEDRNGMMLTTVDNPDDGVNDVKFDIGKDQKSTRKRNCCIGILVALFLLLILTIGLAIGFLV